jgi:hypothetical protein
MREYRRLALQAQGRAPLYTQDSMAECTYRIPKELANWFTTESPDWPMPEPHTEPITATLDALGTLGATHLAAPLDGTPPVEPDLRLSPRE